MNPVQSDDQPPMRIPNSEPNASTPAKELPATPQRVNVTMPVADAETLASNSGEM